MFEHEHVFWAKYDLSTFRPFSYFCVYRRYGLIRRKYIVRHFLIKSALACVYSQNVGGSPSQPSASRPLPRHLPTQIESTLFSSSTSTSGVIANVPWLLLREPRLGCESWVNMCGIGWVHRRVCTVSGACRGWLIMSTVTALRVG